MSRDFIHRVKSWFQACVDLTIVSSRWLASQVPGTKLRDTRFGDLHARLPVR